MIADRFPYQNISSIADTYSTKTAISVNGVENRLSTISTSGAGLSQSAALFQQRIRVNIPSPPFPFLSHPFPFVTKRPP